MLAPCVVGPVSDSSLERRAVDGLPIGLPACPKESNLNRYSIAVHQWLHAVVIEVNSGAEVISDNIILNYEMS